MKWTKSKTIKANGKETRTYIIYDDIESAVSDYMCPTFCENCVLQGNKETGLMCNFDYAEKHEQEVANLIGLKLYEDNPSEKYLLDWTLKEVMNYCSNHILDYCVDCSLKPICGKSISNWVKNENRRKLGSSEVEYLKWAYRLGYEYITCDSKNGVYLHKKMPTWLMAYDMFGITEGSEKSEFAFTIWQGEHWGISNVLEENKNV